MNSQQQLVEELFCAALEHSPEDREAFLDRACGRLPGVRQQVETLLLDHALLGSFLQEPLQIHSDLPSSGRNAWAMTPANMPSRRLASSEQAARFQPGQIIGSRFTVVRFIARGGMGEVYEVEDRFLQHLHVALKVVLPEIAADAGASHRFEQEVLLARKITHPNLCPIYDIALCHAPEPAFLFLTMKLLQGETLAARLRSISPLTREESISIFHQIISGVAAIHAAGVIHRDIKPNNVMLDHSSGELSLSIMDFGLARLHESETTVATRGLVAGTPGYIAPELFLGHRPSQATDIYALGVLLHQVLTGRPPISKAANQAAEPLPALAAANVPRSLIRAVQEFLAQDPKRRCDAFSQLIAVPEPHRPLLTRRRFVIASAVAACAAAGAGAGEWDRLDDWMHPLPRQRFVALLNWPTPDARLKPMLLGVIDAIAGELSRAEAFDHDLFVIAEPTASDLTTRAQLNEAREALGANLVLAAYGVPRGNDLHLSLRVFDPPFIRALREKEISVPLTEQASLPDKAVRAAARLLNVASYRPDDKRTRPGTESLDALSAFQDAEKLMREPNDSGLDAAIEKYKLAVDLDPHYAKAYARLAAAYLFLYRAHGDATAIALARANCESALKIDPDSTDGHLDAAWIQKLTGNLEGASREIARALALDPSDPHTLVCQGQIYVDAENWAQAEATYARVLKMRPNYWLAHNELGFAAYQQGKYSQALEEFQSASLASPRNAFAFSNLGDLCLKLGKLEEALENSKKSFEIKPNDAAAITLAAVYRVRHDYAHAIAYAEKATRLAPMESADWLELGDCYAASGMHKAEAGRAYLQAVHAQEERLRINARNGPDWMLLALCRVKANRRDTAFSLLQKAESSQADDVDSQLYKARALELLGHRAEALSTVARCLRKGATKSQVDSMPDLEELRKDSQYRKALNTGTSSSASVL